ncbi:MAG: hypothetical protein EXX96DRAFT_610242 [Benjaminiella poitrasii]|nr:MAG: hypothetical protein EXX96DRAFT_610242 [Benjaminiella poitrasii]
MFCLGARKKQSSRSEQPSNTTSYAADDKSTFSRQGESCLTLSNQPQNKQNNVDSTSISQLQQEYNELKAKSVEHLEIIARQTTELEQLREELHKASSCQMSIGVNDHETKLLEPDIRNKEGRNEKESSLEESKIYKQPSLKKIVQDDNSATFDYTTSNRATLKKEDKGHDSNEDYYKQALEEKDKLLREKQLEIKELKMQWEAEKAELVKPVLEQVTAQLDELKETNIIVNGRLTEKENELAELRAELNRRERKPKLQSSSNDQEKQKRLNRLTVDLENDRLLIHRLDELNQQLEAQKQKHESILKSHAKVIAEKDKVLLEHQKSLKTLKSTHESATKALEQEQMHSLNQLQLKHQKEMNELSKRLKQAESQAKSNVNSELDKILVEFEQSQHNHSVQVENLKQTYQKRASVMLQGQQAEIRDLMSGSGSNSSLRLLAKFESQKIFSNQSQEQQPPQSPVTGTSISKLRNNSKFVWPPIAA